jgi:protein TonB
LAKQKGISGQVILQYVVSSDGTITQGKILKGIGGGCEQEALRVLNAMPKWNPGKHNGRTVPVTYTLQIKFVRQ